MRETVESPFNIVIIFKSDFRVLYAAVLVKSTNKKPAQSNDSGSVQLDVHVPLDIGLEERYLQMPLSRLPPITTRLPPPIASQSPIAT